MKTQTIVTKDSLQHMLNNPNPHYVMTVVGRGLVHIFNNQTNHEQHSNSTQLHNGIGFAGCDAKSGSITAKFYIKHQRLETWMVDKWVKKGSNGYSRLTKYHSQLNQIATSK